MKFWRDFVVSAAWAGSLVGALGVGVVLIRSALPADQAGKYTVIQEKCLVAAGELLPKLPDLTITKIEFWEKKHIEGNVALGDKVFGALDVYQGVFYATAFNGQSVLHFKFWCPVDSATQILETFKVKIKTAGDISLELLEP